MTDTCEKLDVGRFRFHYYPISREWIATHPERPDFVWSVPLAMTRISGDDRRQWMACIEEFLRRDDRHILTDEPHDDNNSRPRGNTA